MNKTYAILGAMFLLVGCGDAQFSSAAQPMQASQVNPDRGTTLDLPADDAGSDSAVTATDDSADAGSVVTVTDAGQDAAPVDWNACCNDCASAELLCLRGYGDGGYNGNCVEQFNQGVLGCGTAPNGAVCNGN